MNGPTHYRKAEEITSAGYDLLSRATNLLGGFPGNAEIDPTIALAAATFAAAQVHATLALTAATADQPVNTTDHNVIEKWLEVTR